MVRYHFPEIENRLLGMWELGAWGGYKDVLGQEGLWRRMYSDKIQSGIDSTKTRIIWTGMAGIRIAAADLLKGSRTTPRASVSVKPTPPITVSTSRTHAYWSVRIVLGSVVLVYAVVWGFAKLKSSVAPLARDTQFHIIPHHSCKTESLHGPTTTGATSPSIIARALVYRTKKLNEPNTRENNHIRTCAVVRTRRSKPQQLAWPPHYSIAMGRMEPEPEAAKKVDTGLSSPRYKCRGTGVLRALIMREKRWGGSGEEKLTVLARGSNPATLSSVGNIFGEAFLSL
ncbi:hypothetical protein BD779DRAFT_1480269 [Infundibulicybe gibba]|nr:hypothetical protein BD779DRAFT_1480269 [Infundibulicybe gibba]